MSALSGTLLNALTVLVGGLLGTVLGDRLPERLRENVVRGVGLFTLAMGTKFAIDTSNLLYMLGSILIGGLIGSLWGVDRRLSDLGAALQRRFAARGGGSTVAEVQNPNQAETDILAARATQALTAPISAEVGKVVEEAFGVDTFQLTPSFVDPSGQQTSGLNPTARLTIGKRVSDRVYLTFSRSLGTTINDQIVLLEYEESDRLSWILSRNEDQQTYALEFRVRHTF